MGKELGQRILSAIRMKGISIAIWLPLIVIIISLFVVIALPKLKLNAFFKKRSSKTNSSVKETMKLFTVWEKYSTGEGDSSHYREEAVTVNKEGKLFLEHTSVTSDMHSLMNSSSYTTKDELLYEELSKLIEKSTDPNAKNYIGMTENNWRTYFPQE